MIGTVSSNNLKGEFELVYLELSEIVLDQVLNVYPHKKEGKGWMMMMSWQETEFEIQCLENVYAMKIGEGNGDPLRCCGFENPRDRGAWWASIYGVQQSRTRLKRLSSSSSTVKIYVYEIFTGCRDVMPCFISHCRGEADDSNSLFPPQRIVGLV